MLPVIPSTAPASVDLGSGASTVTMSVIRECSGLLAEKHADVITTPIVIPLMARALVLLVSPAISVKMNAGKGLTDWVVVECVFVQMELDATMYLVVAFVSQVMLV